MSSSVDDSQKLDPAYFIRLATVLAIVAVIWLGTNLFDSNSKTNLPTNLAANETASKDNEILPESQGFFAASLPVAENVFLMPRADSIQPIRKWGIEEPNLTAKSIYVIEINTNKVLLQKESDQVRPIASLSKLITALVILDKAKLDQEILVSQKAIDTEGETGNLVVNEKLTVESLLDAMLIESSNDAAVALAEKFNGQFISAMNEKSKQLALQNTYFTDPSGLSTENVSTAKELAKIMRQAIKYPLLNYIMKTQEKEIFSLDGKIKHKLTNTNKLLTKYPEIIAGKTGYLDEAGNCMAVATKAPDNKGIIITVILSSQDRIGEMDKLLQWEKEAFLW